MSTVPAWQLDWAEAGHVTCAGEMLYMGSPAQPVFKSAGSEKPAGPKQEKAKLMFQTWPIVQPAIAFGILTLSTYITAVVALGVVALYGGALQVHFPSSILPTISNSNIASVPVNLSFPRPDGCSRFENAPSHTSQTVHLLPAWG